MFGYNPVLWGVASCPKEQALWLHSGVVGPEAAMDVPWQWWWKGVGSAGSMAM